MSAEAPAQSAAAGENAADGKESQRKRRWETLVEVVEVIVLAIAAVATSLSGYAAAFDQGSAARDNAERYLRDTVLFATVLFVVAIAQRFKVHPVRVTTTAVALSLAGDPTVAMLAPPRA